MEVKGKGCGMEGEGMWKVKERDVEGKVKGKGCGKYRKGMWKGS